MQDNCYFSEKKIEDRSSHNHKMPSPKSTRCRVEVTRDHSFVFTHADGTEERWVDVVGAYMAVAPATGIVYALFEFYERYTPICGETRWDLTPFDIQLAYKARYPRKN